MKLSEYLASNAITASDFAREINRSVSTVTRIVNGESKPDWSTMARIDDATDGAVKPNDFLPAAGEPTPGAETGGSVDGSVGSVRAPGDCSTRRSGADCAGSRQPGPARAG